YANDEMAVVRPASAVVGQIRRDGHDHGYASGNPVFQFRDVPQASYVSFHAGVVAGIGGIEWPIASRTAWAGRHRMARFGHSVVQFRAMQLLAPIRQPHGKRSGAAPAAAALILALPSLRDFKDFPPGSPVRFLGKGRDTTVAEGKSKELERILARSS